MTKHRSRTDPHTAEVWQERHVVHEIFEKQKPVRAYMHDYEV